METALPSRVATCIKCAIEFSYVQQGGRRRKYCSAECSREWWRGRPAINSRPCIICGELVARLHPNGPPRSTCDACRLKSCRWCGVVFDVGRCQPSHIANKNFCSAECRYLSAGASRVGKAVSTYSMACEFCGFAFAAPSNNKRHQRFCGEDCHKMAVQGYASTPTIWRLKRCRNCPRWIDVPDPWQRCSACAAEGHNDVRQRVNAKRKAAPGSGKYTFDQVVAKSKGRCHLCLQSVDPTISRRDRMGGTVDHIVPLSLGGHDELWNVALAHLQCNCKRGNRVLVQLQLAV